MDPDAEARADHDTQQVRMLVASVASGLEAIADAIQQLKGGKGMWQSRCQHRATDDSG